MTQPQTTESIGPRRPRRLLAAAIVLVLAVPVLTWWTVGDLSYRGSVDLDYFIQPPEIGAAAELAIGITALVLATASVRALAQATRTGDMDQRWWTVLLLLSIAGAGLGAAWRVLTAGGIGANIGAGIIIMIGPPMFIILVVCAALLGWRIFRHPRSSD
jgi:hypothetical protein